MIRLIRAASNESSGSIEVWRRPGFAGPAGIASSRLLRHVSRIWARMRSSVASEQPSLIRIGSSVFPDSLQIAICLSLSSSSKFVAAAQLQLAALDAAADLGERAAASSSSAEPLDAFTA